MCCVYRQITFLALALSVFIAINPGPTRAQDRTIVFGDSLSDDGNLFTVFPFFTPPPYFNGGAANGPLWPQQLFGPFNSPVRGTGVAGNVNMAYFGARTDIVTTGATVPGARGLPLQISDFVAAGGRINPKDLVAVWAGANNIRECIDIGLCVTPQAIRTNARAAANAQIANIQRLIGLGARTLLVPNAQNLGDTPFYPGDAAKQNAALDSSIVFNSAFFGGVRNLAAAAPPGTNIIYADLDALQNTILANPAAFGFSNTTVPCFDGTTVCANPNSFYFWDSIHPTSAVQAYFALYFSLLLDTSPAILDTAPLGDSLHRSDELVTNAVFDRLSNWFSGVYAQKNGPYAEVIGQLDRSSSDGVRPGYDFDEGGVRIGWDQQFNSALLGASVAITGGPLGSQNLSADLSNVRGDVYGIYNSGPAYASLDLGFAGSWIDDIERATGFGPVVANSETEGYVATASAEVGIAHKMGGIVLIPSARLSYKHAHLDGFQEDAPLLALDFDDRKTDAVLGRINLRAVSNHVIAGAPTAISAEVGYAEYISFTGSDITAVLANNTALPTTVSPGNLDGPGILGKIGLSSQISEMLYFDVNYGIAIHNDNGETHSGSARLKAHF